MPNVGSAPVVTMEHFPPPQTSRIALIVRDSSLLSLFLRFFQSSGRYCVLNLWNLLRWNGWAIKGAVG